MGRGGTGESACCWVACIKVFDSFREVFFVKVMVDLSHSS